MSFVWPTSHVGMLHPFARGSKARSQAVRFLKMAEAAKSGRSYDETKTLFKDVDTATVETRKSLYEEIGLLYVPKYSGTLHLTGVGRQFLDLLGTDPPADPSSQIRKQVDTLLCWAMAHSQIDRPQSLGSPSINEEDRTNCDIRPYATFWQAMLALGGTISFDEFSQVIAHIQTADDFPTAVQTILRSRDSGALPAAPKKTNNFGIYWRSHLSVAGVVLKYENGQFSFVPGQEGILKSILDFQMDRAGNDLISAIRAKPWSDINDYYSFAGQGLPENWAADDADVVPSTVKPSDAVSTASTLQVFALQPQTRVPRGTKTAPSTDKSRKLRRAAKKSQVRVELNPILSEQAEDLVEMRILRPQYGNRLIRVGHRSGETIALPDGMVPGADFYVIDNHSSTPTTYVEIKSVTGVDPFDVMFTRAEYLRAIRCAMLGIPYRLILVDVATAKMYEVKDFATGFSALKMSEAVQIVIRVAHGSLDVSPSNE